MTVLDEVERARECATLAAAELKRAHERAERWRKLLDAVAGAADERPAWTAAALSRAQSLIKDHETEYGDAVAALRALWQDCQQRAKAAVADSVRTFPDGAETAGLKLDSSSRHPRYSFDSHAIDVELVERELVARIDVRHGERVKEPLDVPSVVDRVLAEHRRLFERPWKAEEFLTQLYEAYQRHQHASEGVSLRQLATTMAGKGKRVRLDEFAVDLGRLVRDPAILTSPVKITTNQTRDTEHGLLLHGLEHGGYVLSICMEKTP